jgi:hypothetical protein
MLRCLHRVGIGRIELYDSGDLRAQKFRMEATKGRIDHASDTVSDKNDRLTIGERQHLLKIGGHLVQGQSFDLVAGQIRPGAADPRQSAENGPKDGASRSTTPYRSCASRA